MLKAQIRLGLPLQRTGSLSLWEVLLLGRPVHPFCGGEATGSSFPHAYRFLYRREEHQEGQCWAQPGMGLRAEGDLGALSLAGSTACC